MKKLNVIDSSIGLTPSLLLLVLLIASPCFSQGQNSYADFWKDQVEIIDLEQDQNTSSLSMLKEMTDEYEFFFTAEEHWQAINPKIQFHFLTFLHKHAGVRNLILEGGFAYGALLNRYLDTGNEKLLIRALYDTPVCPRDQMEFYRNVYQFNQSLPESDRIWVVGIDLEQSPLLVTECLYRMLPNKALTAGVRKKITQLKTLHEQEGYSDKEARKFYRQWYKEWQERKRAYKRYWGEEYWLFEMILGNLVQGFDMPVLREFVYSHGDDKKREMRMYNNFKLLNKHGRLKAGKYYGQFGGIHTEIKPAINWGFPTLAQNLNEHNYSPVQGKVLTISKYFRRVPKVYEKFKEFDEFMEVMSEVDAFYEDDIVLFQVSGNEDILPNLSKNFQFIMIVPEDLESQPCR